MTKITKYPGRTCIHNTYIFNFIFNMFRWDQMCIKALPVCLPLLYQRRRGMFTGAIGECQENTTTDISRWTVDCLVLKSNSSCRHEPMVGSVLSPKAYQLSTHPLGSARSPAWRCPLKGINIVTKKELKH